MSNKAPKTEKKEQKEQKKEEETKEIIKKEIILTDDDYLRIGIKMHYFYQE